MSDEVIKIDGDEVVVREDTAKAYRGVNWALMSLAAFILIAAALMLTGVLTNVFWEPTPGTGAPVDQHSGP